MFKKCSFCGKRETPLNPMLTSVLDEQDEINICKICVESANEVITEKKQERRDGPKAKDEFDGDIDDIA